MLICILGKSQCLQANRAAQEEKGKKKKGSKEVSPHGRVAKVKKSGYRTSTVGTAGDGISSEERATLELLQ